jgi:hypothetical protein
MTRTAQDTFLSPEATAADRVLARGLAGPNACIVWTGTVNSRGYGQIRTNGVLAYTHRVVYEARVAPVPDGMLLDHRCHNRDDRCTGGDDCQHRRCVNPDHLEPVTAGENQRRSPHTFASIHGSKTHCLRGHPFDSANTYVRPDNGGRQCRQCRHGRAAARNSTRSVVADAQVLGGSE